MHVDGGTTHERVLHAGGVQFSSDRSRDRPKVHRRLWVVRNGKIAPEYKVTSETTLAIAKRSLETLPAPVASAT